MAKQKLTLNDPLVKAAIIILGIGFVTYFSIQKFILTPHRHKIAELEAKLEHINIENTIVKLSEEININEKSLPPQKNQSWLLAQLTKLSKQANINIETVEPLPIQQIPPYSYASYRINITCTYTELANFIELIEAYPHILNIESLNIGSKAAYVPELPKEQMDKKTSAGIDMVVGTIF